jgi:hypothetical protein
MTLLSEKARALLEYCLINERVCPKRDFWNHLWVINAKAKTFDSILNQQKNPLLDKNSSEKDKLQRSARLRKYIEFADKHNLIVEMDTFIRSIPEEKWHHFYESE